MNIFYLDKNPKIAAQSQCDKHVVKMILESCQLLCAAHHLHSQSEVNSSHLYKLTHKNHSCSIWTRTSKSNYIWLAIHTKHLCNEYTFRYGKVHKSTQLANWLLLNIPNLSSKDFCEPPQCMPEQYTVIGDSVAAYRKYYKECKQHTIKFDYTKRERPIWLN